MLWANERVKRNVSRRLQQFSLKLSLLLSLQHLFSLRRLENKILNDLVKCYANYHLMSSSYLRKACCEKCAKTVLWWVTSLHYISNPQWIVKYTYLLISFPSSINFMFLKDIDRYVQISTLNLSTEGFSLKCELIPNPSPILKWLLSLHRHNTQSGTWKERNFGVTFCVSSICFHENRVGVGMGDKECNIWKPTNIIWGLVFRNIILPSFWKKTH